MTRTKVATANLFVNLSDAAAEAGLRKVLAEDPDLLGLQEWGPSRHGILKAIERAGPMRWARPDAGGSPVMWNRVRYRFIRCRAARLARSEFVGHLAARKSRLPASWATELVVEDRALGGETVLIDAHLTAEVQFGEGYRKDAAHRLRVARHKREVRRIRKRIRHHQREGRRVYVVGDFNFDGLALPPLISCWKGRDGGTLGNRAVDQVHARERAATVKTIDTASDHRAVVASYEGGEG